MHPSRPVQLTPFQIPTEVDISRTRELPAAKLPPQVVVISCSPAPSPNCLHQETKANYCAVKVALLILTPNLQTDLTTRNFVGVHLNYPITNTLSPLPCSV
jgi:hypothetical protein